MVRNNIVRLVSDVSRPWLILIAVAFMLVAETMVVLRHPHPGVSGFGALLTFAAITCFPPAKVAIWRTLPITRVEIGRALWWQMVGIPGILLTAIMTGAAVLAGAFGIPHAEDGQIALAITDQFFFPVAFTTLILTIGWLQPARILWKRIAVGASLLLWLMPVAAAVLEAPWIQWCEAASLPAAILLYWLAPKWPLPSTSGMLSPVSRGRGAVVPVPPGCGGWRTFVLNSFRAVGPLAILFMVAMLLLRFCLPLVGLPLDAPELMVETSATVIAAMTVQSNVPAMRMLRTLPARSVRLTSYLFFPPLAFQAAFSALSIYLIVVAWPPGRTFSYLPLLAVVIFCDSFLVPLWLRLRDFPRIFVTGLSIGALVGLSHLAVMLPPSLQAWIAVPAVTMALLAGFAWTWWEIAKDVSVYRYRPINPARWRGVG